MSIEAVLAGQRAWAVEAGDVLERLAQLPEPARLRIVGYLVSRFQGTAPECKHPGFGSAGKHAGHD